MKTCDICKKPDADTYDADDNWAVCLCESCAFGIAASVVRAKPREFAGEISLCEFGCGDSLVAWLGLWDHTQISGEEGDLKLLETLTGVTSVSSHIWC